MCPFYYQGFGYLCFGFSCKITSWKICLC
jgi:hypothetical protein